MGKYIKCRQCNTINEASAYECVKCHSDLTKRQNKIMNIDEEALVHDYEHEDIKECRCAVCGAINPVGIEFCLACAGSLKGATELTQAEHADIQEKTSTTLTMTSEEKTETKKSRRLVDIRTNQYYELEEGDKIFGREHEWGAQLSAYGYVSRRHFMLRVSEDETQLYVIETANGTYMRKNGFLQLLPVNSVVTLKSGDLLGLGGDETNDINVGIIRYEEC